MLLIKFRDLVEDATAIHYGINAGENIVCGCCGGLFPKDEEGETFEILRSYDADSIEDMIREAMEG